MSFWVDAELRQQFKLAAVERGVTMTEVVTERVKAWLTEKPPTRPRRKSAQF